jgi:hypothetical protein
LNLLTMAFWTSTHGNLASVPMVYRTPYRPYIEPQMVFWPPTQGILNPVPMVYWTPYL